MTAFFIYKCNIFKMFVFACHAYSWYTLPVEYSSRSPCFFLVSKTNLAVHEDKNRVPYVKVQGGFDAQFFILFQITTACIYLCISICIPVCLLRRFNWHSVLNAQGALDPEFKQFPEILMGLNHLFALFYRLQAFTSCYSGVKF